MNTPYPMFFHYKNFLRILTRRAVEDDSAPQWYCTKLTLYTTFGSSKWQHLTEETFLVIRALIHEQNIT